MAGANYRAWLDARVQITSWISEAIVVPEPGQSEADNAIKQLYTGYRPSKYLFSLLSTGVDLEELLPILRERERRCALDRERGIRSPSGSSHCADLIRRYAQADLTKLHSLLLQHSLTKPSPLPTTTATEQKIRDAIECSQWHTGVSFPLSGCPR